MSKSELTEESRVTIGAVLGAMSAEALRPGANTGSIYRAGEEAAGPWLDTHPMLRVGLHVVVNGLGALLHGGRKK